MSFTSTTWMAASADGRLEVFVVGSSQTDRTIALWHLYQVSPGGGWSQWIPHGSAVAADHGWSWPQVAPSADGRLELFMSFAGELYHIWQVAPNGGWTTWTPHTQPPVGGGGQNTIARRSNGCLDLFTVVFGTPGEVAHSGQTAPSSGWSGWTSVGTPSTGDAALPLVAANADGRLQVFVHSDGVLWNVLQASETAWSGWGSLGTPPGTRLFGKPMCAAGNSEGRLEVFAVGEDGALWHIWQTSPNGGWSQWFSHGTPPGTQLIFGGAPAIAAGADGRLELFVCGDDQQLWHIWQTAPSGGWSPWHSHGTPPGTSDFPNVGVWETPALALNAQRRLELFVVGTDGRLFHLWQTAPGQGWSDWLSHGTPPGYTIFGEVV